MGLFGRDRRAKPRCLRLTKKLEERQRICRAARSRIAKSGPSLLARARQHKRPSRESSGQVAMYLRFRLVWMQPASSVAKAVLIVVFRSHSTSSSRKC